MPWLTPYVRKRIRSRGRGRRGGKVEEEEDKEGRRRRRFAQFSSRWQLCARKSPCALRPVCKIFRRRCHWNGSNVRLTDDGSSASVQGRSSSAFAFHIPLFQAIDGVLSLALRSRQCLKLISTKDLPRRKPFLMAALPASLYARPFPFTPACPQQNIHRSLRMLTSNVGICQSGLPIPLMPFCSKLNESVRMMAYVWSDCHLLRQSSEGHGWLLTPSSSSWRLRSYWLNCLHGSWSHLAWQWNPSSPPVEKKTTTNKQTNNNNKNILKRRKGRSGRKTLLKKLSFFFLNSGRFEQSASPR